MCDEGLDQHGRFSLTDKRTGSRDDSLGTRYSHGPVKEDGEFSDEPLDEPPVEQKLNKGHEEDDGWKDREEEVVVARNVSSRQKCNTIPGEFQQVCGKARDKVENVKASLGAEHKQGNDELDQHTNNDGVPHDHLAVVGGQPEAEDEDEKTEDGDGSILSRVVLSFWRGK